MTAQIQQTMAESSADFLNIVWPRIRDAVGGGRIIPVETVTDSTFAKELDIYGGVDMWQILGSRMGMRGIASRVQWKNPKWHGRYPFNTFTIRWELPSGKPTERHKRMHAIEHPEYGLVFPAITVQAYMDKPAGMLLSVGIVYTRDLFDAVQRDGWQILKAPEGTQFRVVPWSRLTELGYKMRIIEAGS